MKMDSSFGLLSSMSPKIKLTNKTVKKGSDKGFLALRKHIRRSSILDRKEATIKTESLVLIESSSASSYSTASSNPPSQPIILNETPIVIPDSESDEENDQQNNLSPNSNLSKKKTHEIEEWLTKVNSESQKNVETEKEEISTCFTEISAIVGDDKTNTNSEGFATNSTFINVQNRKRFDELFKTEKKETNELDYNSDDYADCEKLLDKLYGTQWRAKKEEVLPKSEPRMKKTAKKDCQVKPPLTDVKRKPSVTHKNPYFETEKSKSTNLLKTLHSARIKKQLDSPWMARLKDLCDSDSEDDCKSPIAPPKLKLNFDDGGENLNKNNRVHIPLIKGKNKENCTKNILNQNKELTDLIKQSLIDFKKPVRENKPNSAKKILNDWRDSGKKIVKTANTPKSTKKTEMLPSKWSLSSSESEFSGEDSSSSSDEDEEFFTKRRNVPLNKTVTGYYSFLASLSGSVPLDECDMSARIFRTNYNNLKTKLAEKLFKLFNESVFENKLPFNTPIKWNVRLNRTAGYCKSRKITRNGAVIERKVEIELSTKILDSADRLRDTLIHEMCHAATWMVNHVSDGHGQFWKSWAFRAMKTFPELPPIKRCHTYKINTKYTYKCVSCGYSIGRHSKSLDIERKRCGYCYGKFQVLLNKVNKNGEKKVVVATPGKNANGFALFVKENYSKYRTPELKHGDVMKILGQKFSALKVQT